MCQQCCRAKQKNSKARLTNVGPQSYQEIRHIYPMFDQCWPTVYDAGPTLVKHWVDVSCLPGIQVIRESSGARWMRKGHQLLRNQQCQQIVSTMAKSTANKVSVRSLPPPDLIQCRRLNIG